MSDNGAAGQPALQILRKAFAAGGFGFGLRQEFLRATILARLPADLDWTAIDAALAQLAPPVGPAPGAGSSLADRLLYWTAALQEAGGQPVFEPGRVIGSDPASGTMVLALPTLDVEAVQSALAIVSRLIFDLIEGASAAADAVSQATARASEFVKRFSAKDMGGSNVIHFLRAAYAADIPIVRLTGPAYQIGLGSKARWLDSSMTDVTPAVSIRIARNKIATADLLRSIGLPVPRHEAVGSAEQAVAVAGRLGYPVVVKPFDRDGGVAVAAGLKTPEAVARAYETARNASPNIIVEKFVEGRDYRLVVFEGRLIWALERVPGGVTGDGSNTVGELVRVLNSDPARSKRADAPLKPLEIDDEALEMLEEQGLTLDSVPPAGERVRLRRAANIASGGTPEAAFDNVHPDNRDLAEQATAVMRLDIAGLDLLIPDISRSWLETGAAICEVNAQPTIGSTTSKHLYRQIVNAMVEGQGRIPIAVVVGEGPDAPVAALLSRILRAAGLRAATADARQARNGQRVLAPAPGNAFTAARAALLDRSTDALVMSVSDTASLDHLFPFDRCSIIVLAGDHIDRAGASPSVMKTIVRAVVPLGLFGVAVNLDNAAWRGISNEMIRGRKVAVSGVGGPDSLAELRADVGNAVFIDRSGETPRLVLGGSAIALDSLGGGAPLGCTGTELALAVSAASMMGCALEVIRRGLGDVERVGHADGLDQRAQSGAG
jgi:cyanophycin synthetase